MTTVTVPRAVLEQALEALEQCGLNDAHRSYEKEAAAKAALRAALAQQEDIAQNLQSRLNAALLLEERRQEVAQPRREWQSLTDEEIKNLPLYNNPSSQAVEYARAVELALKEKNA